MHNMPSIEQIVSEKMAAFQASPLVNSSMAGDAFASLLSTKLGQASQAFEDVPVAADGDAGIITVDDAPRVRVIEEGIRATTRRTRDAIGHSTSLKDRVTAREEVMERIQRDVSQGRSDLQEKLETGEATVRTAIARERIRVKAEGDEDGEGVDPKNLLVTIADFKEMMAGLKEYGFSDEQIEAIREQVQSDSGLTWGELVQFLSAAMQLNKPQLDLTQQDKQNLQNFFNKLGFDSKESAKLVKDLEQGNAQLVMRAVAKKLDQLPEDAELPVNKQETDTLLKALALPAKARQNLAKVLDKVVENAAAMPKELREGLEMIRQQLVDNKDTRLVKLVDQTLEQALERFLDEGVKASVKDVAANLKISDTPVDSAAQALKHIKGAAEQQREGDAGQSGQQLAEQRGQRHQQHAAHKDATDQNPADLQQRNNESARDTAWRDFFAKLNEDVTSNAQRLTKRINAEVQAHAQNLHKAQTQDQTQAKPWDNVATRRGVFEQVNRAMLRNLGPGKSQMRLMLKPENLGHLNVMVHVSNKDVRAVIKADNPEAARLIADQLEAIRQSLENQGLKVTKLEVQTGLAGQQDSAAWQGEDQHNKAKEQEEMARVRDRWRNLRGGAEGITAAEAATVSGSAPAAEGIHLIA